MYVIGVDIGGTNSGVVLGDTTGKKIVGINFVTEVEKGSDYTIDRIKESIYSLYKRENIEKNDIEAIGISCGGPLDQKRGLILSPPNLPGWDRIPITDIISQEFGVKSFLENDANSSALAEWKQGAGRGYNNLIFLTFGTGLGAGLILDGRLYRGTGGLAGEVGHIRLTKKGPIGYNKQGSFEGYCSGSGIANLAQIYLKNHNLAQAFGKKRRFITAKDVGNAAAEGNHLAREILVESGTYLGKGLSILIDTLNPEIIILGGIYVRCREYIEPAARRSIEKETLIQTREKCRIVPAQLGEEIGDYASLAVAIENIDKS
ncbi:MAG: ROK family protein [Bacillota bacterium]